MKLMLLSFTQFFMFDNFSPLSVSPSDEGKRKRWVALPSIGISFFQSVCCARTAQSSRSAAVCAFSSSAFSAAKHSHRHRAISNLFPNRSTIAHLQLHHFITSSSSSYHYISPVDPQTALDDWAQLNLPQHRNQRWPLQ